MAPRWLGLLKAWADERGFKHPHVNPDKTGAGGNCIHYGIYAAKPLAYLKDPYSMGLATFTRKPVAEVEPTVRFLAHGGLTLRVPERLGAYLNKRYGPNAMQHITQGHAFHATAKQQKCSVKDQYRHNCIVAADGRALDTCIEHTGYHDYVFK